MPGWLKALTKGLGGVVGGAAQGARDVYPSIMQSANQRATLAQDQGQFDASLVQDQAQFAASQAQDQSQFDAGLQIDERQMAETETRGRWERALARREMMWRKNAERRQGEIDRIRVETARTEATTASRTAANATSRLRTIPAAAQSAIIAGSASRDALTNYRNLSTQFFNNRGRFDRALGVVGYPQQARDAEVGQLESARVNVLMNVKDLAALGVLNPADEVQITRMIGDPVSTTATLRDPSYTLAKLDEAQNYIDMRLRTYQENYGVSASESSRPDNRLAGYNPRAASMASPHVTPRAADNPYRAR